MYVCAGGSQSGWCSVSSFSGVALPCHGSANGGVAEALRMRLLVAAVVLMVLLLGGGERAGRLE